MLHQNSILPVEQVALSPASARTLIAVSVIAAILIAAVGVFSEAVSALSSELLPRSTLHLFGVPNNLASWYQSLSFGLVALLWFLTSAFKNKQNVSWLLGSTAALYMSLSELTNLDHSNWAYMASFVGPPYLILPVLGFMSAFIAYFWFRSVFPGRRIFLVALVVYSAGAFGLELIASEIGIHLGRGLYYALANSAEELLEIAGCALLFIATVKNSVPRIRQDCLA